MNYDEEKRLICCNILNSSVEQCCEVLIKIIFGNKDNIWRMFRNWVYKLLEQGLKMNDILNKIYELNLYISITGFKNYSDEKWYLFFWPFGTDEYIYISFNYLDIYSIQCFQKMILDNYFCQFKKDIFGFDIKYNSFKYNLFCNKFIDKQNIINLIKEKINEINKNFQKFILLYESESYKNSIEDKLNNELNYNINCNNSS
jgi:hypothetical protein